MKPTKNELAIFKRKFERMKYRCSNPNSSNYHNYGGRGIKVEWETYDEFERDMLPSFVKHFRKYGQKQTSIDRVNPDGNYCKENCRWETMLAQYTNRRDTYRIPIIFVERALNTNHFTLRRHIKMYGYEKALKTMVDRYVKSLKGAS